MYSTEPIIVISMLVFSAAASVCFYYGVSFILRTIKDSKFKDKINFLKHYLIPEEIDVSGRIVRLYNDDNVWMIGEGEDEKILNSSITPDYYIDVVDINNKITTVKVKDFGFIGRLIRKIDSLDTFMPIHCHQYSFDKYPFVP